jgi:hypothetical protein
MERVENGEIEGDNAAAEKADTRMRGHQREPRSGGARKWKGKRYSSCRPQASGERGPRQRPLPRGVPAKPGRQVSARYQPMEEEGAGWDRC